jgi:ubiquitin-like 1-activating enzyme E1 B
MMPELDSTAPTVVEPSTTVHGFAGATALDALYGEGASRSVSNAKVLVVGAGGVGCELVKNLACAGFACVTLIDLDTVDVSNLNRQFLFRRKHVGASKADVAAAAVEAMVPGVKVKGIVGNVKDPRFNVSYFKEFSIVCNALDNLEARRHVNRMCLAAEVILVESGSTGYNGQVTVIGKGKECYDCNPKPAAKTYAVCTIRSTPDTPVHCVVWAKHLWDLVFGADDKSNVLRDLDGGGLGGDQSTETYTALATAINGAVEAGDAETSPAASVVNDYTAISGAANDESALAPAAPNADDTIVANDRGPAVLDEGAKPKAKRVRYEEGEDAEIFAVRVCERVFMDDIEDQIAMKSLWEKEGRTPPTVFNVSPAADAAPANLSKLNLLEPRVWSREESAAVLKATLVHVAMNRTPEIGTLSFDKDDADALAFVVAASNLRAAAFGVEMQSPFAVKGIAGNIVHAIATTNAMVAGLIVLEAIKIVVEKGMTKALTTFVRKTPAGNPGRRRPLLCSETLADPIPGCYVCSKGMLPLAIDVETATLKMFIESVCKKTLGAVEPTVNVTTGDYFNTLHESGQGLEDDEIELYESNLGKTLKELRVETGSEISIDDTKQNFSCSVVITHAPGLLVEEKGAGGRFELGGTIPRAKVLVPAESDAARKADANTAKSGPDDDDFVVEVIPSTEKDAEIGLTKKRALDDDDEVAPVGSTLKKKRSGEDPPSVSDGRNEGIDVE